jgi:hypothetical protein
LPDSTTTYFKKLVSILFTLIAGCATKHSGKALPPTQLEGPKLILPSTEQEKVLSSQFLIKVISQSIFSICMLHVNRCIHQSKKDVKNSSSFYLGK